VLQIYKEELGNADGLQLFLVGNIDEQKLKPLLERYIASLPVLGTVPEYKDNGLRPLSGNQELYVEKGSEAQSLIVGLYYGEIPYTKDLELKADLVSDVLNIRITEELREQLGGIYSGSISASLARVPYAHYTMQYYLPCGPESVDTLLKAFTAEITAICTNGPAAKDLAKVKQAQLEAYKGNRKRNGFWAANLAAILFWGDDPDRILHFERHLGQVSAKDLQTTAQRLFDGGNTFRAVLDPAKK
jgi:zinc protease